MALLADEAEASALQDLSNAASSSNSSNGLSDLEDGDEDAMGDDSTFRRGKNRATYTTFIESPIGPSKGMEQPIALTINEPSAQDSVSYGEIDDFMSVDEEGHVG